MPVFNTSHHFHSQSTDSEPPPQIRRILSNDLLRLFSAKTILFNQNQSIQKHPRISRIFFNCRLQACFQDKPSFSIKINRFYPLPSLRSAGYLSYDVCKPVVSAKHHSQSKSTDIDPPSLESAGFLSNDVHNPVFSTDHHFKPKSTDFNEPLKSAGFISNIITSASFGFLSNNL